MTSPSPPPTAAGLKERLERLAHGTPIDVAAILRHAPETVSPEAARRAQALLGKFLRASDRDAVGIVALNQCWEWTAAAAPSERPSDPEANLRTHGLRLAAPVAAVDIYLAEPGGLTSPDSHALRLTHAHGATFLLPISKRDTGERALLETDGGTLAARGEEVMLVYSFAHPPVVAAFLEAMSRSSERVSSVIFKRTRSIEPVCLPKTLSSHAPAVSSQEDQPLAFLVATTPFVQGSFEEGRWLRPVRQPPLAAFAAAIGRALLAREPVSSAALEQALGESSCRLFRCVEVEWRGETARAESTRLASAVHAAFPDLETTLARKNDPEFPAGPCHEALPANP
ncbi:MAG TPA: hypothetical protein VF516_06810 [Kofleriaceae bacterium]